ncbi:uncharacterized protein LOC123310819 [Coccinella septempunctata]|uniref:uncharacterized protein LOC123310819 n=1 Tax=Coccinella septempunctata TaxID=41139 RepID=UPI001D0694B9|nr:uncharacterized protein LOC123310819 [Coccinella septempunctata]
MSKKTYDVSTPRTGSFSTKRNDSSFSSCLCTMLVILAICSLLLLLSFSLKKAANKKEYKNGRGKFERIIHENASARNDAKEETSQEIIETTQEFARTTQKITSVPPNTEKLKEVTGDSESEETMTVPSTIVTVEEKKDRRFDEAEGSQETTSQITSTQSEFTSNTPPVRETVPSKTILDNGGGTETIFTESTTLNSVEYETTDENWRISPKNY